MKNHQQAIIRKYKFLFNVAYIGVSSLFFACATTSHVVTRELLLGNEAAVRADYSTSTTHYEAALKLSPNSTTAKRNLGIVLVKVGQYERARKYLNEILTNYADDLEVYYFLGEACRGVGDFNAALQNYNLAQKIDASDLRIIKAISWTYFKLKMYDKSLAISESVLRNYSGDLQLKLIIANNYNHMEQFKKSVLILSNLEKNGFKVSSRDMVSADSERALLILALADAYFGLGECKKADSLYQEVLKTRPFLATALVGSAKCDLLLKNENKAVQKLERAARANPEFPDTYFLLGSILAKQDTNRSIFYLKRFILLTKNSKDYSVEIKKSNTAIVEIEKKLNTIKK